MDNSNFFSKMEVFLSEDFGRYPKGSRVIVHEVDFYQRQFYALVEMEDGEMRTMEVEYLTTGGELVREKRRQIEKLKERPDLICTEEKIQGTAEKMAKMTMAPFTKLKNDNRTNG